MESAMTPQQAIETIAQVRGYRERLTARAAGIVWMVWGLALALMFVGPGGVMVIESERTVAQGAASAEGAGAGATVPVANLALVLVALAAGAAATNAVWRAHALERGERHPSWVAWAAAFGFLALLLAAGLALVVLVVVPWIQQGLQGGSAPPDTRIVFGPAVAAAGAAVLCVLQRRRVPVAPGLVAASALVLANLLLPLFPGPGLEARAVAMQQAGAAAIVAAFVGTGLWHARAR